MKITEESKGRILFVNNDPNISEHITRVFKEAGYETVIACSISAGLKLVNEDIFELFLIDCFFENGTSIDLCRSIRLVNGGTPILFYIADSRAFNLKKAMQAGAQGCFVNPIGIVETRSYWSSASSKSMFSSEPASSTGDGTIDHM